MNLYRNYCLSLVFFINILHYLKSQESYSAPKSTKPGFLARAFFPDTQDLCEVWKKQGTFGKTMTAWIQWKIDA